MSTNRTAFVTGAARGIGLAIAERLARDGASVTAVDIDLPTQQREVDALSAKGLTIRAGHCDVTSRTSVEEAVKAIKRGAIDFLIKPFQLTQLAQVLHTGINERRLQQENAELRAQLHDRFSFSSVIGQSAPMQHVFSSLELVSPMNSTVLIHGETGTGKELIARTIHHNSPRADQRFVAFNAAAIPETLAEAELSDTRREPSPAPCRTASAASSSPIAARSSSTRSG